MSPRKKNKNKTTVSHKLADVVRRELGLALRKEHQRADWSGDLEPGMMAYAAEDSRVLRPLAEIFAPRLTDAGLEKAAEIERRALPAVAWMALSGVPFDAVGWRGCLARIESEMARLKEKLEELAPAHPGGGSWNWASWQQVLRAFSLLGVELPDTKEETLARCAHPLAKASSSTARPRRS